MCDTQKTETQTERKHTPLSKVYTDAHCIMDAGSASLLATCNTKHTAEQIALACNSHHALLDVAKRTERTMRALRIDFGSTVGLHIITGFQGLEADARAAIDKATKQEN